MFVLFIFICNYATIYAWIMNKNSECDILEVLDLDFTRSEIDDIFIVCHFQIWPSIGFGLFEPYLALLFDFNLNVTMTSFHVYNFQTADNSGLSQHLRMRTDFSFFWHEDVIWLLLQIVAGRFSHLKST